MEDTTKLKTCAVHLEFENITFSTTANRCNRRDKSSKQILNGISGNFKSGRLTGVLGPSGAGKSSLLNILAGFRTTGVGGLIKVNGRKVDKSYFKTNSCYISQEFAMLTKLTTKETLNIAASVKLRASTTLEVKTKIVNNIVKLLNLSNSLNTYVGDLSGGERKRLSIGVELVSNPPLMFFDEPTSGLDSVSSVQVIKHLRNLAQDGRTVVCVIHQPASKLLEMFDDLYVVSEGHCLYQGPLNDIVPVFGSAGFICPQYYNRADFVLEVASRDRGDNFEQLISTANDRFNENKYHNVQTVKTYNNSKRIEEEKTPMLSGDSTSNSNESQICIQPDNCNIINNSKLYPISQFRQFGILLKRSLICTRRDFYFAQMRVICHILIGLLIGAVFYNIGGDAGKVPSNASCLFFFLMFIFFANSMPTVQTFPQETAVFLREHLNNWYSLKAYYFSKVVADLPLQIICPSCFIIVAYWLTGQPYESERLGMLWLVCLLMAFIAQSLGLVAGAAFEMQLGIFLVPASCIPMLVFSGFFIHFNELPEYLQPISHISYFRYAFESSIHAIYGFNRETLNCSQDLCMYKSPKKFLSDIDMLNADYWVDIGILCAWGIGLQILLFIVLKVRLHRCT